MTNERKFGTAEAVYLTTLVIASKAFYTSIRVMIKITGTAAWYMTIVSCLTSIIFFLLISLVMKRFPGKNLVEIFELVTGRFFGKILTLVFSAYFVYYAGSSLREFLEMIKAYNLPYTPPSLIIFAFMAVVVVLAYIGLEGMVRFASVIFYPVLIGIALILFLAYPYYNVRAIFPIGGYGIAETLKSGFFRSSAYDEVIILAFIINSIDGVKKFRKVGVLSLFISGIVFTSNCLCNIMAFDYTMSSENVSDLFQLARVIYFSRFFQRIESIFLFIWILASLITVGLAFYIAISSFCKAFKISNHRPLILQFAFLTFMVTLLPEGLIQLAKTNIVVLREYSMILVYGIPVLILFISVIFGKRGDSKCLKSVK
ncbi:spore germination protein [Ruminiclostridium papyrosolvens DSM 2782]|uniref:Spore germination protein n=1 Tax=Ruminiclostridium papyrosolvens DSM 2782 TaxID=588581 RepID=F1TAF7_9FIRM|nr:endospore germination permease [Ruminiclostridium papyrosolvens]EGD48500.1 spore germination protein [Ruminiclostridium papyrosolvens DSM 2782]WES32742.1 endospore germination permease [Ruminiclostridium papyrosolvens DSM 2782]